MTNVQWKPGDRVQYRRAGPVMHVIATSEALCYCNWHDAFGRLQRGTFESRHLCPAEGSPQEWPPLKQA